MQMQMQTREEVGGTQEQEESNQVRGVQLLR